jgi:hypothetical protein
MWDSGPRPTHKSSAEEDSVQEALVIKL